MLMNDADATRYTPQRRRRSGVASRVGALRLVALLVLVGVAAGCASTASSSSSFQAASAPAAPDGARTAAATEPPPGQSEPVDVETQSPGPVNPEPAVPELAADPAATDPATGDPAAGEASSAAPERAPVARELAAADIELPAAPIGFDSLFENQPTGPFPVAIAIKNIDVQDATIIPVGVNNEDLSFEVPPADQVGWYEFGPVPGQPGSAVLAAHIAYNGVDGVFRYLENVEVGSIVVIDFDDGSSQRYRIEEVTEYVKEKLPDSLFARDGREQLALITCGGAFNYQLDSYESNTVAIAVPVT